MLDYQPYPIRDPNVPPPDMLGDGGMGMPSGPAPMQQQMPPPPPPQPPAERLSADILFKMYLAWEQAKVGEIHEQFVASRYYHGKQWTDAELKVLKRRKQPATTKNRIRRKLDGLVGIEQRLRRDPKAFPRNPNADQAAPVATAVLRSVEDANSWPALASECSRDALIRGIGVQCAGIVMRKGKADIKKRQIKGDRFFYDPRSEDWAFEDALYLGEHGWFPVDVAKEMLPWAVEMLDALGAANSGGMLTALPQEFVKEKNWQPYVDAKNQRVRLIAIWYKHKGEWLFDFLVGPISLCPSEERRDDATGEVTPPMDCRSPYLDENDQTVHQYIAWSPYIDEANDRYGPIRDMIPVQDEINKRSSKALHLLTVRQTKGEKGAVDDVDKMKAEMAKGDGHVETNPGRNFEVLEQTAQIQGNLELLQEAKGEIESVGPNQALQGRNAESQSGRAILAQQNAGMADLSPVFERLREWKLRCYRRDWNLIRQFYTDERYIRITGDPNAVQYLKINVAGPVDPQTGQPLMQNVVAEMDVDIILDEGPDTVTMREELLAQLSDRPDIPSEVIIEMSNLPDKDILLKKLAEHKAPPPELKALQDRMAQLEEMTAAANIDKARADTEATRATTIKTLVESGALPQAMQAFPFYYREPTLLDQAQHVSGQPPQGQIPGMPQPNALGGPPGNGSSPGGAMPPPNALAAQRSGAEVPQDYLAGMAPYTDPRMPTEPRLGERGGLPLPPNQ